MQNEPWSIAQYQVAIEDIERTKRRQYELGYYSALINGGMFLAIGYFDDANLDSAEFYVTLIVFSWFTFLFTLYFQMNLIVSLAKFRRRLVEFKQSVEGVHITTPNKTLRDLPFAVYLSLFPLATTLLLTWYALGKAQLLSAFAPWLLN